MANVRSGPELQIDQAPKPMFSTVFRPEHLEELRVGEVDTIIRDGRIAGPAFGQMARRVAVARGFSAGLRVQHHGTAHQCGGKRVLSLDGVCRAHEGVIGILVQFLGPRHCDPRRAAERWPVHQQTDRRTQMRIGLGKVQGSLFCLNAAEIRKQFQILSKARRTEGLREGPPQMRRQLLRLALFSRYSS